MKALILNSGLGSRMGVLTSEHPKCMTEVSSHETILSRQLRLIAEAGITEVVITTGYYDAVLVNYCHSLELPIHFTFVKNPIYDKTNYIYSIYCAREYLDDDILLMHGDLVFEEEVFDKVVNSPVSCMTVSSTLPLPEKDFKAVVKDGMVLKVGVDLFNDAMEAQALYFLKKDDWKTWLGKICEFCESGNTKVYAENALNELNGAANIHILDVENMLCSEIDNPEDLAVVSRKLKEIESRTVYMCFASDIIHAGHIRIIKRAEKLGKLIIGVLSDEAVSSYKRKPLIPASDRKMVYANISGVSQVVDQNTLSYKENLLKYKPDIVVHGDDWLDGFQRPIRDEVTEVLASYGGKLVEFPYSADLKYQALEKKTGFTPEQTVLTSKDNYAEFKAWVRTNVRSKLMIVCDDSIKFMEKFGECLSELKAGGTKIVEFSDFCPNPLYESVVKGVELFHAEGCDSLMAVGGGSAIDVAKCIKLYLNLPGDGKDGSWLKADFVSNDIPFIALPTTAGTGSEATRYAVIYYNDAKQSITSESIIPETILMDPHALLTLPLYQKKATMMDALCHAIESYWSVNSTKTSREYSREAIRLVLEHMDGYLSNNEEDNAGMLRAAHMAGKAINITQTTAGHAMCYKITSLFRVAHGHAAILCDRVLLPWMLENTDRCIDHRGKGYLKDLFGEIASAMGCVGADGAGDPKAAAAKLSQIFESLELEVPKATPEQFEILKTSVNPVRLKNHPIALDVDTIDMLYHKILKAES